MGCKSCEVAAEKIAKKILGKNDKGITNTKKCTKCEEMRKKEADWLNTNPLSKHIENQLTLTPKQKTLMWTFLWGPLIVGYLTILYLIFKVIF